MKRLVVFMGASGSPLRLSDANVTTSELPNYFLTGFFVVTGSHTSRYLHSSHLQSLFLSLSSYDCKNLIFGQTFNPLLYTRSPGGSSGGEGALIGGGGSILGFGTDVGGSLRFPAAFCGICALKPTGNRLRYCE